MECLLKLRCYPFNECHLGMSNTGYGVPAKPSPLQQGGKGESRSISQIHLGITKRMRIRRIISLLLSQSFGRRIPGNGA